MLRFGDMSVSDYEPAVLAWGDEKDLRRFRDFIQDLRTNADPVRLNDSDGCQSADGTILLVSVKQNGRGLMKFNPDLPKTFWWEIDSKALPNFVDMIEVVASAEKGHHYLDGGELTLIVSKGEYPDDFLQHRTN